MPRGALGVQPGPRVQSICSRQATYDSEGTSSCVGLKIRGVQ